jgi:GNAT superfamily N-acetyltransferase
VSNLEIVPFREEHLDEAASLLAARHRAGRMREPELPARFEDPSATLTLVKELLAKSTGVVAFRGGRLAGYLLGTPDVGLGWRFTFIPSAGHAVDPDGAEETYREMYAAAAPEWLARGFFVHSVYLPADDRAAVEAWFSLGFGKRNVHNWRDTSPATGKAAKIEIRRVGPESIGPVHELDRGLGLYAATSPLLMPYLGSVDTPEWRVAELQHLSSDDRSYWLAYEEEMPVALMTFAPPDPASMFTPGNCIYLQIAFARPDSRREGIGTALLNRGLEWAREAGFSRCTVDYRSANLIGARFWRGKNFKPLGYILERRIDERIAWATGLA